MSKHVETCPKFSNLAIAIDMVKSLNGKMSMWKKVQIEIGLYIKVHALCKETRIMIR